MSNGDTHVKVQSEGSIHLRKAIELSTTYHSGNFSKGDIAKVMAVTENAIYFGWHESMLRATKKDELTQVLFMDFTLDSAVPIIIGILNSLEYGEEPDTDGSTSKGWELTSGWRWMPCFWDSEHREKAPLHIDMNYVSFVIRPHWMKYGK